MNTEKKAEQGAEKIVFAAILICLVAPFASDSYVPSLPAITHALGSTARQIQLTMTFYFLGAALSQLIYGPLSDRFGRRIMILTGLSICMIGSFLCVISTSGEMLIAARCLQGFGGGACNGLFRAVLRDSFRGPRLAQIGSYIGIIFPLTFALAPVIGGYVETWAGWRANFFLTVIIVFLVIFFIAKFLPETNKQPDKSATSFSSIYRNYKTLLSHPGFMGYALLASFTFSAFICYFTVTPFLLQNIVGLTPVQFGWLSILLSAASMAAQFFNSRGVVKYGLRPMILIGILLMCLSGAIMLVFALFGMINTFVIVVPAMIFSLASGFVLANVMAGAFEYFGHIAGTAGAVYGFLQMTVPVVTSTLLAHHEPKTQLPLAVIFTSLGVICAIIFILLHRYENSSHR